MASVIKKTTGIAGLNVAINPEHMLRVLYGKILRAVQALPPQAAYRKYTEELVTSRLQIIKESKNAEEIESKINSGQIEELILLAEKELLLARKLREWRPWEPLVTPPPPKQWSWPPE